MALGMTPTQAYGGTRIQETNQSKNGQCTGTIIDPTGEPVIGATVTVKTSVRDNELYLKAL